MLPLQPQAYARTHTPTCELRRQGQGRSPRLGRLQAHHLEGGWSSHRAPHHFCGRRPHAGESRGGRRDPRKADRQTDRRTPRPRAAWGSPPALPLQPRALCPVYKGKGSSVFVFLGLSNAFLAPLVSRQGRGCLDETAQIYLSWKLAGNGAEPPQTGWEMTPPRSWCWLALPREGCSSWPRGLLPGWASGTLTPPAQSTRPGPNALPEESIAIVTILPAKQPGSYLVRTWGRGP